MQGVFFLLFFFVLFQVYLMERPVRRLHRCDLPLMQTRTPGRQHLLREHLLQQARLLPFSAHRFSIGARLAFSRCRCSCARHSSASLSSAVLLSGLRAAFKIDLHWCKFIHKSLTLSWRSSARSPRWHQSKCGLIRVACCTAGQLRRASELRCYLVVAQQRQIAGVRFEVGLEPLRVEQLQPQLLCTRLQ